MRLPRRRAQVEAAVGDHAHRVEQLAAEELHAHDALGRVALDVFLQQEQVVGQPVLRFFIQQRFQVGETFDQHDARAAAALLGLEQHREGDLLHPRSDGVEIVEGPDPRRRDAEAAQQRGLRRLGELQRERAGPVQHPHSPDLERAHVGEGVGHGARIAAHVGRGTRLVEVKRRERRVGVGERGLLEVDRGVTHAAALEGLEQRLLPLRVLEKYGEICAGHDRPCSR
jgi:hypothetical protein